MEKLHCPTCGAPKWHQTVDFYDELIHGGSRCLTCGNVVKSVGVIRSKPFIAYVPDPVEKQS